MPGAFPNLAEIPSMTIPGELKPALRVLMGPGPSDAHPRILRAMATPLLGHLDPEFLGIMNETQEMLRQVFETRNTLTMPISGTGSAGMETCLVNLLEPGDKALICVKGYFGQRLVDIAQRTGAAVSVLERPWGEVFPLDQIRAELQRLRPKVCAIVHAETSTGARQPIDGFGKLCHEFDCLAIVDTVTALGGVPVEVDKNELDAVYSCSQKCLSCPPGLSPITFSARAMETISRRKTKVQSWYLDVSTIQKYWGAERVYHHTAPITMVYALREGLRIVLEEGLPARFARQRKHAEALKAGVLALGLGYAAAEGHQLPQLHAIRLPTGADDAAGRQALLSEFGIEVGGGLGEFKGKVWRVGLMGVCCRANNVLLFLGALERVLAMQGIKLPAGAGVAAANRHYQEHGN
jgi:alanine-glyoxylate transaminase/serine-glyoxylate transaminase/serine-pyruvate transaminase